MVREPETADDAVVIDLVRMQAVDVDPSSKTARAQGGARPALRPALSLDA